MIPRAYTPTLYADWAWDYAVAIYHDSTPVWWTWARMMQMTREEWRRE